jgi:hypothetical protein
METTEIRKSIFEDIYKNNIWTCACENVKSGHGSEMKQTVNIRNFLNYFLTVNPIESVVD